ncbi:MAG: thioredoxin [Bacteroidales bacterium]|nr:thioredoxin [Bacteroidales bacterium]
MTTGTIIALAVGAFFLGLIIFNYRKMKNTPEVKKSDKIKILTTKNFKFQTRVGMTLVDFWAPWCKPCLMMAPILNDVAEQMHGNVVVGKLNIDQNQFIAKKNKVRNIPTLILFQDGIEIHRFVGVKTKKHIIKELQKAID